MAFRILRQRKEARRNAKLEEIFQERDKNSSGTITFDQLEEIYRVYQVELDDGRASRVADEAGLISKEEFIQFAKDTHLLDFETTMGEASPMALLSPRKTKKQPQTPKKGQNKNTEENTEEKTCPSMLGCFFSDKKLLAEVKEEQMDKVELAFRKFDLDGDGFLSWEEFQQLCKNLDQEQALRMFHSCNQSGTGLISLDEFYSMVNRKHRSQEEELMEGGVQEDEEQIALTQETGN